MTATPRVSWFRHGLLLSLLLAGCTSPMEYIRNGFKVGPNYGRPPAAVENDWIDADQRIRRDPADLKEWWTVFNDPVLNSLIAGAYEQNLTLREAGFRVLQARAQLAIARGNLFPQQQNASGGYSRNAISIETANNFAGIGFPGFPGIARFFDQNDFGFGLAWELDFWGRFRRAVEAADAELDASVEDYDDVLVTLLSDVASTYVEICILEQQIDYTRTNVALQLESLRIAEARFKGGQASELDVDQAQSNLSQTEAQVPQLEIALRQAENRLCILLGIPPEDLRSRLGALPIPTTPVEVAVGIPAELLSRRPDVRAAERRAAAQSARIGIAESDLYPAISITGTIGWSAENVSDMFRSSSLAGSTGPSFQWNLLNYGRILNNVRLQDARFQELVVRYQNVVLRAGQEVEDGLVSFVKSQEQTRYLAESVVAAEKAVKIAVVQYKGGLVDFNRVALLEQNLVTQQNLLAQARGNIALGLIQVYRALGGGWQIRLAPPYPTPLPPPAERIPAPQSVILGKPVDPDKEMPPKKEPEKNEPAIFQEPQAQPQGQPASPYSQRKAG